MLQILFDALSLGSLYALGALGIALIFGVMRLVNFAHGDVIAFCVFALLWPSTDAMAIVFAGQLPWYLLVPFVLWVEKAYQPAMWLHMVVWLPLFTILCTLLLRPVKGAVVGWMMALGFTGEEHGPVPEPSPIRGTDG